MHGDCMDVVCAWEWTGLGKAVNGPRTDRPSCCAGLRFRSWKNEERFPKAQFDVVGSLGAIPQDDCVVGLQVKISLMWGELAGEKRMITAQDVEETGEESALSSFRKPTNASLGKVALCSSYMSSRCCLSRLYQKIGINSTLYQKEVLYFQGTPPIFSLLLVRMLWHRFWYVF